MEPAAQRGGGRGVSNLEDRAFGITQTEQHKAGEIKSKIEQWLKDL